MGHAIESSFDRPQHHYNRHFDCVSRMERAVGRRTYCSSNPGAKPQITAAEAKAGESQAKGTTRVIPFTDEAGWKPCHFGGDGRQQFADGMLKLGFGDPLTGMRYEGDFPKTDYEVTLEARRVDGFDFFCGLTLPAGEERFSVILGGWGGSLVGLSSIDSVDASGNETNSIWTFEPKRWYKLRVRVTQANVTAWLGDDQLFSVDRKDKILDVRAEMEECTPVGLACYQTEAEYRNFTVRLLK